MQKAFTAIWRTAALAVTLLQWSGRAATCDVCFYGPDNLQLDSDDNIYLADNDQKTKFRIIKLTPAGEPVWQWTDFAITPGRQNGPEGMALTKDGVLLVTDGGVGRIVALSKSGRKLGEFGSAGNLANLGHVVEAPDGRRYVAEGEPGRISIFLADGTKVGEWSRNKGSGPDDWNMPQGIAALSDGSIVVEDWGNRRLLILDREGRTDRIVGSRGTGQGQFQNSAGIFVDRDDHIYVADAALHRVQEFDGKGDLLGIWANSDERALFETGPTSVAVDQHGDIYSADGRTVVKISKSGELLRRFR